jgi:hypothetical protein
MSYVFVIHHHSVYSFILPYLFLLFWLVAAVVYRIYAEARCTLFKIVSMPCYLMSKKMAFIEKRREHLRIFAGFNDDFQRTHGWDTYFRYKA